ncbi:hypothetical protein [Haloarcula sp. 1CSR25-25]|uniref:hypothetical protein n=1 Tax=Haloarcula sp. 1CSR25-25 TaxID=2862545 RepID=UPI0028954346|nr:hypothetical protein [Haloarcula sp. 1CSR25-25]MDT3435550.1 hypothetical protein [Haloarcula sp. 1CSR25-25]
MVERTPAKRIPKSLGTETKLLGSYTLGDIGVALLPAVAVVLLTQLVVPSSTRVAGYTIQTLLLPVAAVAACLGTVFVYVTPAYTSSLDWLVTMVRFHTTATEEPHSEALEHHQLARVYPTHDAIERRDGAVIGLVRVSPPSMALATDEEWGAMADGFQDFLNTTVTFPIQIYSTTQPFPVETYLDHYRDRLDDPDVKANPQLRTLIERYIDWYERDLAARQMTIRDHYVVVTVTPEEVQFERESVLAKVSDLPVLGVFVRAVTAPPLAVQRRELFTELDDRLSRVQSGLRDLDGCEARIVDASDATQLIGEFWAGQTLEYGDFERTLRTRPLVGDQP